MRLRPGHALVSVVDTTSVIVVKVPQEEVTLTCGGVPMVTKGTQAPAAEPDPAHMRGSLVGKRYTDPAGRIEVLVTKGGTASLAVDGEPLEAAAVKALPSSD